MAFAENLRRLRDAAGLTQEALATKLKIPVATLRNWERARREPRLAQVEELARALGCSTDALIAGSSKRRKAK